jgi:hypothetical protein
MPVQKEVDFTIVPQENSSFAAAQASSSELFP